MDIGMNIEDKEQSRCSTVHLFELLGYPYRSVNPLRLDS